MAIEDVVVTLKADLDDNGLYDTDWTTFLRDYKVDLVRSSAVDRFGPRRASFILDNTDSRFSPRNTSSPYSPNLVRGKRVRLSETITVPAATNLMRNPSAETNTTFWTGVGFVTISQQQAGARFGKFGIECLDSIGAPYGVEQDTGVAPATGNHTASVYCKGVGDSIGEDCRLLFKATGGAGGTETATKTVTLRAEWQRIELTLNVVAGDHTDLTAEVERQTSVTLGEKFYTDALLVETGASASIYCDGDQPECTWSGTAHASTSNRTANPTTNLFTGELREFNVGRKTRIPFAEFVATGLTERVFRAIINAGPFTRKGADLILQRLLDILEGPVADSIGLDGEVFKDGANRYGGDAILAFNATVDKEFDTGKAGGGGGTSDDPEQWDAMEGDNVVRVTGLTGASQGWKLDVSAVTKFDSSYRVGVFVRAGNAQTSGQDVRLRIQQGINIKEGDPITLSDTVWKYLSFIEPFSGVDDLRQVFVLSDGAGWGAGDEFWTDCHHMTEPYQSASPLVSLLPLVTIGTKWTGDLEYVDAFEESGGSVLELVAKSIGGWLYENGDGDIVFEDYTRRDNAVVTIPKLRLSDIPQGGHYYDLESYSEPAGSLAGVVRVGSLGNITVQPAPDAGTTAKVIWQLEPHSPPQFSANEIRTFTATYTSEGDSGGLIARRAVVIAVPGAGWAVEQVQTPYVRNYGRAGQVVFKAPGSTKNLVFCFIGARINSREVTERSFIEFGGDVSPIMELDMPAQGYKTTAMNDLLIWALVKYNASPASMEVVLSGASIPRLLEIFRPTIGLPVWVEHVQGAGNLGLSALFYTEGIKFELEAGRHPRVTLTLEEAT